MPLALAEVDNRRRLSAFYPGEVLSITHADYHKVAQNPTELMRAYDVLATRAREGSQLVDVGSNEERLLLDWAVRCRLDELLAAVGVRLVVTTVTTIEPEAFDGAVEVLNVASDRLPKAGRVLIFNEFRGDNFDEQWDVAEIKRTGTHIIRLPRCHSELWPYVDGRHAKIPFCEAAKLRYEDAMARFGMDLSEAARATADFGLWFRQVRQNFKPLFVAG